MFERRLKIFLALLFVMTTVLLVRAAQLQVFSKSEWQKQAETLGHRRHLIETTRGTIVDVHGREIAIDEPCIDACVDYGAIAKDPIWVKNLALKRMATTQPGAFRRANEVARAAMLKSAEEQVDRDIDAMWSALAREANQPVEKIEDIRQGIEQRVQMRERYLQFQKFEHASEASTRPSTQPNAWYQRVLAAGSNDNVDIDNFEFHSDEQHQAHPIVRNISSDVYTRLAKEIDKYPGLVLKQGAARRYPYGSAACHLLGHLGVVDKEEIESAENQDADPLREYLPNDLVGRGGLEQLAEPSLRGTRGYVEFPAGEPNNVLFEQKGASGALVKTKIDIELQAQVQNLFAKAHVVNNRNSRDVAHTIEVPMHGAAVILDVASNEVRVMASYPDFDPNQMQDKFDDLSRDFLNSPLMNRATHSQLEPGSTVKPLVGLGAITQGLWTVDKGIECTGYLVIRGRRQPNGRCWMAGLLSDPAAGGRIEHHCWPVPHHGVNGNPDGWLNFADAIERSCNVYFENLADLMGPEGLAHWFGRFGLGHETGLGIAEARGHVPGPEDRFPPSLVWFSGIGQTRVMATPIQMANAVATIARDGIWMKPRLIVGDAKLAPVPLRDGRVLPDREDLKLDRDAVAAAKDGMTRVVNAEGGTGLMAHMTEVKLAGKTGTAQAHELYELDDQGKPKIDPKSGKKIPMELATWGHPTRTAWYRGWGDDGTKLNQSWFVGFAPADHPQVAFVVMVQYGGSGGIAAGSIAKQALIACAEHEYLQLAK